MIRKFWSRNKTFVLVWFSLRVHTILCSVFAASLAGSSILGVWERWDAVYYARIASVGYSAHDGTTNFHPLFPWLARLPLPFTGAPVIALLAVSSFATLGLYIAFEKLARLDTNERQARIATLAFALWPISYVLYLPYTESLWLLCAVTAFILARRNKWWTASVAGAAATLTRQQGLILFVPLAWELWITTNHDWKAAIKRWRSWLALSLIPLAYLSWIVYRTLAIGELRPKFDSLSGLFYSTLLSPATSRVVQDHAFIWPWKAGYLAIRRAASLSYVNPWVDLFFGFLFLLLIGLSWRGMRTSYRIYVVLIALVSFSFHTGMVATGGAYLALPRHLLLAFPVFIGLISNVELRWKPVLITAVVGAMTFLLFGYFWVRVVP